MSLCFTIFPNLSKSVYYATDGIYIYDYGKRVYENNIIFLSKGNNTLYSKKCNDGLCLIGQQFYPVIIYKTKNNSILTYNEFDTQQFKNYYKDYPNEEATDRNLLTMENYKEHLKENSDYSISFNPGPSEGGEGCGFPGCLGGRIGNDRYYVLNINNGNYNLILDEPKEYFLGNILSIKDVVYLLIPITVLVLVIYFKRKRNKKEIKHFDRRV